MTHQQLQGIKEALIAKNFQKVDAAVILGSGLGGFEHSLSQSVTIPYHELDGLPETTVIGHSGALSVGYLGEKVVLVFSGRFHHYEGHDFETTVIPVKIAQVMGAKLLLVSNAAGGINVRFQIGDLMLIDDLANHGFRYNPFDKPVSVRYRPEKMIQLARKVAVNLGISVQQGTYMYATGPTYETAAEIRAFRIMGGDAVGMSTAPELNYATKIGMECLGITLVTNMATGISKVKLDHAEIKEVGERRKEDFKKLVGKIIEVF